MNIYPSKNAPLPSSIRTARMRKPSIKGKAQDVAREAVRKRRKTRKDKPEDTAKKVNSSFAAAPPPSAKIAPSLLFIW